MSRKDRLFRIANRLGKVSTGSAEADRAIHEALDRTGPILPHTTDDVAAEQLLPPGFELYDATYAGARVYASCRRSGAADRDPRSLA
jgi:hypothetical protein